jgi:hypothetical protein
LPLFGQNLKLISEICLLYNRERDKKRTY